MRLCTGGGFTLDGTRGTPDSRFLGRVFEAGFKWALYASLISKLDKSSLKVFVEPPEGALFVSPTEWFCELSEPDVKKSFISGLLSYLGDRLERYGFSPNPFEKTLFSVGAQVYLELEDVLGLRRGTWEGELVAPTEVVDKRFGELGFDFARTYFPFVLADFAFWSGDRLCVVDLTIHRAVSFLGKLKKNSLAVPFKGSGLAFDAPVDMKVASSFYRAIEKCTVELRRKYSGFRVSEFSKFIQPCGYALDYLVRAISSGRKHPKRILLGVLYPFNEPFWLELEVDEEFVLEWIEDRERAEDLLWGLSCLRRRVRGEWKSEKEDYPEENDCHPKELNLEIIDDEPIVPQIGDSKVLRDFLKSTVSTAEWEDFCRCLVALNSSAGSGKTNSVLLWLKKLVSETGYRYLFLFFGARKIMLEDLKARITSVLGDIPVVRGDSEPRHRRLVGSDIARKKVFSGKEGHIKRKSAEIADKCLSSSITCALFTIDSLTESRTGVFTFEHLLRALSRKGLWPERLRLIVFLDELMGSSQGLWNLLRILESLSRYPHSEWIIIAADAVIYLPVLKPLLELALNQEERNFPYIPSHFRLYRVKDGIPLIHKENLEVFRKAVCSKGHLCGFLAKWKFPIRVREIEVPVYELCGAAYPAAEVRIWLGWVGGDREKKAQLLAKRFLKRTEELGAKGSGILYIQDKKVLELVKQRLLKEKIPVGVVSSETSKEIPEQGAVLITSAANRCVDIPRKYMLLVYSNFEAPEQVAELIQVFVRARGKEGVESSPRFCDLVLDLGKERSVEEVREVLIGLLMRALKTQMSLEEDRVVVVPVPMQIRKRFSGEAPQDAYSRVIKSLEYLKGHILSVAREVGEEVESLENAFRGIYFAYLTSCNLFGGPNSAGVWSYPYFYILSSGYTYSRTNISGCATVLLRFLEREDVKSRLKMVIDEGVLARLEEGLEILRLFRGNDALFSRGCFVALYPLGSVGIERVEEWWQGLDLESLLGDVADRFGELLCELKETPLVCHWIDDLGKISLVPLGTVGDFECRTLFGTFVNNFKEDAESGKLLLFNKVEAESIVKKYGPLIPLEEGCFPCQVMDSMVIDGESGSVSLRSRGILYPRLPARILFHVI